MIMRGLKQKQSKSFIFDKLEKWQHTIIFVLIWMIVFAMPWLGMSFVIAADAPLGWDVVHRAWLLLLPYFCLSLINEFFLIPCFYLKKRFALYIAGIVIVLAGFTVYQNYSYKVRQQVRLEALKNFSISPAQINRSAQIEAIHINLPVLSRLSIALLVVGCGLAYNVLRTYKLKLNRSQEVEEEQLRQELKSLRAQISPHFFMNMLNNIHSVMDTDVAKAQAMLMKLSGMLRYVTYDTTLEHVSLIREIVFMRSYIDLMMSRYPADRVNIAADFPSEESVKGVAVPPMIFITFLENAFKHGVTYRKKTDISITLFLTDRRTVRFICVNTLPAKENTENNKLPLSQGVGLANVKRRLEVLYGENHKLKSGPDSGGNIFKVELEIPVYET